jgi:hypothetical protein
MALCRPRNKPKVLESSRLGRVPSSLLDFDSRKAHFLSIVVNPDTRRW